MCCDTGQVQSSEGPEILYAVLWYALVAVLYITVEFSSNYISPGLCCLVLWNLPEARISQSDLESAERHMYVSCDPLATNYHFC